MSDNHQSKQIICADPKAQYLAYKNEIDAAIQKTLNSGWYILGEEVKRFEKEFADYLGARSCVGVANGTDALCLAMRALGIKAGDEVITVSHSAVATVAAIEQVGAIPVFCDIEENTLCIDASKISALVSPKTKAVIVVHIYGQPANIFEILNQCKNFNLFLIEDCAQAHGAMVNGKKVGTFGDVSAFSFYPTKNLGAIGDGGAVVTNSEKLEQELRAIREYGWRERYISSVSGINTRLDEIQAAILSVKLKYLDADNAKRRILAEKYYKVIDGDIIKGPKRVAETTHAMHLFVLQTSKRDDLKSFLAKRGILCGIHYPLAIHQQPAYLKRIRGHESLYATESLYKNILSLPMYPELDEKSANLICAALEGWLQTQRSS